MSIAERILFDANGWISARSLSNLLGIKERDLRGSESPIRNFAISGDRGYRHVRNATDEEIERFCARLTAHANEEYARVRIVKDQKRHWNQLSLQLAYNGLNSNT